MIELKERVRFDISQVGKIPLIGVPPLLPAETPDPIDHIFANHHHQFSPPSFLLYLTSIHQTF